MTTFLPPKRQGNEAGSVAMNIEYVYKPWGCWRESELAEALVLISRL